MDLLEEHFLNNDLKTITWIARQAKRLYRRQCESEGKVPGPCGRKCVEAIVYSLPHAGLLKRRLGLLGSRTVPHGPSESFLVKPQQLVIFQSEYMPVATLARSRGTTSRKLLSDFESKGIETHGAQMEGKTTRGHLVKLSDLASLLSEAA